MVSLVLVRGLNTRVPNTKCEQTFISFTNLDQRFFNGAKWGKLKLSGIFYQNNPFFLKKNHKILGIFFWKLIDHILNTDFNLVACFLN
jgi:hypothetical protein